MDNVRRKRVVDTEYLKSIIENDYEFERELFLIFKENAARNIDKMEETMKNKLDSIWQMTAHAFKGSSASIGAFDLSKLLEYAQKHPEENAEQKTIILNQIKDELKLVIEFIDNRLLK